MEIKNTSFSRHVALLKWSCALVIVVTIWGAMTLHYLATRSRVASQSAVTPHTLSPSIDDREAQFNPSLPVFVPAASATAEVPQEKVQTLFTNLK